MRNIKERGKKVLNEKEKTNIKNWNKRMKKSYDIEILINSLIDYFESVGKNFFNYCDTVSYEKELKHYNNLRYDFLVKKSKLEEMINDYQFSYNISESKFEMKYYSFFETQMEIMQKANDLMPKIQKHCQSSKAGW